MSNKVSTETLDNISEFVVSVKRVTKVTKGGRTFSFSVFLVVGKKGYVGYGMGKAKEIGEAKIKALSLAKKNMVRIPIYKGRTIHHDVVGSSRSAKVIIRKAPAGKGVIAGGSMRSIFNALGIQDVVAKSIGNRSVYNIVYATFNALQSIEPPKLVLNRRNLANFRNNKTEA